MYSKVYLQTLILKCTSYTDLCFELKISANGPGIKKVKDLIKEFNLDIKHFCHSGANKRRKYKKIIKHCPVCNGEFEDLEGHVRQKTTCSYSCSNTFFRSGENNGNFLNKDYKKICFDQHPRKCIVCDESKLVSVHHYDNNHENNNEDNLIPLCPTHHFYMHSKDLSEEILPIIIKFRENFINSKNK